MKAETYTDRYNSVEVRIVSGTSVILQKGESLMEALIRNGYYTSAICGGTGRCGKCKVRVVDAAVPVSGADKQFFSETELNDGFRLSCKLYPESDLTVEIYSDNEADFETITGFETDINVSARNNADEYKAAIDIGTTTIVLQMISGSDICNTVSTINHQRQYGADVLSRIKAASGDKGTALKNSIQKDLTDGLERLCSDAGISCTQITEIAIACNTTMSHLLMGYECETLGKYPFTPVNIDFIRGTARDIIGLDSDAKVTILPGISTYVGGDVVSGLYACGFDKSEDICMLIDLGTNGEMALGNKDRIIVTSTAAGPAFEGGNISCGTGSINGAICSVSSDSSGFIIKTIQNKKPVGICGTGIIELTAELLGADIIDETGLLDDEYFDNGFFVAKAENEKDIIFTQKDIRELQMAKAAVRAGIEALVNSYGTSKSDIARVYIAGGFGYRLDTQKAIAIGMLPCEFEMSVHTVGNSSLAGAVKYLTEEKNSLKEIVKLSAEISLASDKCFNESYIDSMMFSAK